MIDMASGALLALPPFDSLLLFVRAIVFGFAANVRKSEVALFVPAVLLQFVYRHAAVVRR